MLSTSLLRDPRRAAAVACGVWLILAIALPWATALSPHGTESYQPLTGGDAEPVLIAVFSLALIAWAATDAAHAYSPSRTLQLAGPGLAVALTAITISVESKARFQVDQWYQLGWTAPSETPLAPFTLAVSIVAVVLAIWIDSRRPSAVRDRTGSLLSEWEVTRGSILRVTITTIGAVIGAILGLAIGVYLTNGWAYAALLFILLCALGIALGGRLGAALGRRMLEMRVATLRPHHAASGSGTALPPAGMPSQLQRPPDRSESNPEIWKRPEPDD